MYECELPSGRRILCARCPPGSHMQNNCTETQPIECRQRNEGSTNCVCACKEGFYSYSGVCRLCPHGFGVKEKGWVNLTYQCLLEILKMHNNLKLQQFVNGLEIFDNEQVLHSIPDKDACIHHLHRWFSRASEEQVHKLPDQLQKAGMKNLSQKIRNRIHNIQIQVNLCNNKVSNHI
ncbi:hypothetical protein C0J45_9800 [Silurus meridionalis]|nr:hypothetical protein C0J45_9800 [Silurus meridionalis]